MSTKKDKGADIMHKTDQELVILLADARKQLSDLHLEMRTKQIKNVKQIKALKRTIARGLTAQRARELAAAVTTKEEAHG